MKYDALQRDVDELFRRARVLREAGRYAEALATLREAADRINECADGRSRRADEPVGEPVTG